VQKNMEKPNRLRAIAGMVLNIICAVCLVYAVVDYHAKWDTPPVKIPPHTRLSSDENILHILNYMILPATAVAMVLSAFWFWKLRK